MFLDGGEGSLEMLLVHLGRGQRHMHSVFNFAGELGHKREKKRRLYAGIRLHKTLYPRKSVCIFGNVLAISLFSLVFEMHMQTKI